VDPLTHTATGLFLSRAGLKRWTPAATGILLLAASAPDIDVVALAGGPLNYLHWHRNITHSLPAMPVLALLVVAVVRLVSRKRIPWRGAFSVALLGVASHLLLDWTNAYGIRLLAPFSGRWFQLDQTPLFDPWIWSVALICVLGPFLGRLVGSEISSGKLKPLHYGRGFAWFFLAFLLLYNCGRFVLHVRAVSMLAAREYQETAPSRVAAFPSANPWRWHGLVETPDFYAAADVDLTANFDPTRAAIFHKPDPDPAINTARATRAFQEFLQFSKFPLWRVSPAADLDNGKEVEVLDLRFGTPLDPGFRVDALVDASGHVQRSGFHW
jgi:inner membrane protein